MPSSRKNELRNNRPDHKPGHRGEFERNRRRILATETICGICGQPVNKQLKFPDPGAPTIDHIIPINRGGHPSAIENLQLAHAACNRQKGDKLRGMGEKQQPAPLSAAALNIAGLPWSIDWTAYRVNPETDSSNSAELTEQAENLKQQGYIITAKGIQRR